MSDIKVSVIIPVYNASRWLAECLSTVISQTLQEIEIICVDDGSTDGSYQILEAFQKKDDRIKLIKQENAGAGAARNRGLDAASGEYLSFLDADDEFEPEMLLKAFNKCKEDSVDICIFKWGMKDAVDVKFGSFGYNPTLVPEKSVFNEQDIPEDFFGLTNPAAWNKLYRSDFLKENELQFQEIARVDDFCFTYKTLLLAKRITILDEVLMYYRIGNTYSQSNNMTNRWMYLYEAFDALKKVIDKDFSHREKDFLNLVVRNILFVADSIQDREAFESFASEVRDKWLVSLTKDYDKRSSYFIELEYERIHEMLNGSVEDYVFYELRRTKKSEDELWKKGIILENNLKKIETSYYEISSLKSHLKFYAKKRIKNKTIEDQKGLKKNTIDIYGPMEINESKKHWGDYYFVLSLKKEFEKRGYTVNIKYYPDDPGGSDSEYALVLRGIRKNYPQNIEKQKTIMWNISHPTEISIDEYNRYDLVYVASTKYAKELEKVVDVHVKPLLQCTDEEMMQYKEEGKTQELLFIGNTRNVYRQIIQDLIPADYDLKVYGLGWEQFISEEYITGEYYEYDKIAQAYHDTKIVLNDHWDDMREYGFVSNRIFDVLAAQSFVISDDMEEIHELFEGCVETYTTKEDLKEKIDYYMQHPEEREEKARRGQEIIREHHTFSKRVDEIVKDMQNEDLWK